MSLSIRTNIAGMVARRSLNSAKQSMGTNIERLSTGKRINSAADDPAGLSISEGFKNDIRTITQAKRNANDAISIISTSESGISQATNILNRMKELATEANTDSITNEEREMLDTEYQQLAQELDDLARDVEFNNNQLLNGQYSGEFQVGRKTSDTLALAISQNFNGSFLGEEQITTDADVGNVSNAPGDEFISFTKASFASFFVTGQRYTLESNSGRTMTNVLVCGVTGGTNKRVVFNDISGFTAATGLEATAAVGLASINSRSGASFAVEILEDALSQATNERTDLGAKESRLSYRIDRLEEAKQHLQAANSRISDVNVAKETADLTQNQMLTRSAQSMITQANVIPQTAVSLLTGGQPQ